MSEPADLGRIANEAEREHARQRVRSMDFQASTAMGVAVGIPVLTIGYKAYHNMSPFDLDSWLGIFGSIALGSCFAAMAYCKATRADRIKEKYHV